MYTLLLQKKAKKLDRNRHGLMKLLGNEEVSAAGTYFQYITRNELHIRVIVFVHEGLFLLRRIKIRAILKVREHANFYLQHKNRDLQVNEFT